MSATSAIPNAQFNIFKNPPPGPSVGNQGVVAALLSELGALIAQIEQSTANKAEKIKEIAHLKEKANKVSQLLSELTSPNPPANIGSQLAAAIQELQKGVDALPPSSEQQKVAKMVAAVAKIMNNPLGEAFLKYEAALKEFGEFWQNLMSKDHWNYSVNGFIDIVMDLKKYGAALGKIKDLFKDAGVPIPGGLEDVLKANKTMWKHLNAITLSDSEGFYNFGKIFGDATEAKDVDCGKVRQLLRGLFQMNNEHGFWKDKWYHLQWSQDGRHTFWSGSSFIGGDNDIYKLYEKLQAMHDHPPTLTSDEIAKLIEQMAGNSNRDIENRGALPNLYANYINGMTAVSQLQGGLGALSNTEVLAMQAELTLVAKLQKMLEKEVMQPVQAVNKSIKAILKKTPGRPS